MPFSCSHSWPGVVVVGDHVVAPRQRGGDVERRRSPRARRARARAASASPGRSSVFDGMHAQ